MTKTILPQTFLQTLLGLKRQPERAGPRPMTWRFDFQLQMPEFSDREEVRVACCQVLDDSNKKSAMHGLMQSSFSYDVPDEGGLVNISGYLHGSSMITHSFVQRWHFNNRISGEIEWTPVQPCHNC